MNRKTKVGRPFRATSGKPSDKVLYARCTAAEHRAISRGAKASGIKVADLVRVAAISAAEKAMASAHLEDS